MGVQYKNASTKRGITPSNFIKFDVKVAFESGITNKIVKKGVIILAVTDCFIHVDVIFQV